MKTVTLAKTKKRRVKQIGLVKTIPIPQTPTLTPAEQAEVARFEALTKARAAQQAKVGQITRRLQNRNDTLAAV